MTDGIEVIMDDNGVFHEAPIPYATINVDSEEALKALQETVERGNRMRWISVKDRLPERDKEVLCFFRYPDATTVCQNVYYGNGHWLGEGSFVTHWMTLPEPPKEE